VPFSLKVFAKWKTLEAAIHIKKTPRNLLVRAERAGASALPLANPLAVVRLP
jgi:hypothetical protein